MPNIELSDDAILKSLDKYRPDAYFDGNRPMGGGTTDDINDLRDYYRYAWSVNWALGCVTPRPPASDQGEFTPPRAHLIGRTYTADSV